MDRDDDGSNSNSKKQPFFGEIEDVISIGALLRPTIVQAISNLTSEQAKELKQIALQAEKEVAKSQIDLLQRLRNVQRILQSTYDYAPVWRFIVGRIEEIWKSAPAVGVKELSVVSLILGTILEEVQIQARATVAPSRKKSA